MEVNSQDSTTNQAKFIVDGRLATCLFDSSNITVNFLEKTFFSFGDDKMKETIKVSTIVSNSKIKAGFSVYYLSEKLVAKQGVFFICFICS
jgi:hypothetical protein